ncbi:MAG: ATP-dependent Clp protease adaptor ClpS [Methanobacterium sp.]
MPTITKTQVKSKVDSVLSKPYRLMLHNDDYNSFDWVIECLMSVCNHELEQATQCAHIVHNNGKCDVKYGDLETISEMKDKLKSAGLSVTMEVNE